MPSIASEYLIDQGWVDITRDIVKLDNYLDIYLHNKKGPVYVGGGVYGAQYINSLKIKEEYRIFIEEQVLSIDKELDLDFRFVGNSRDSDIAIYFDSDINIEGDSRVLGLAVLNTDANRKYWEIFIDEPAFAGDKNYLKYALIHELGHTFGLEHPFESSDGDIWGGIASPWLSAYPEDTVMAYRTPRLNYWPNNFSANDMNALSSAWSEESKAEGINIVYTFDNKTKLKDLLGYWFDSLESGSLQKIDSPENRLMEIKTNTWGQHIKINRITKSSTDGNEIVQAKQIIFNQPIKSGSLVHGSSSNETLRGLAGWDILDGGAGDDLIHGGNGRDIITGGSGADELHGDFGWNTFRSEQDDAMDLIVVKSDQHLFNWNYGKAGNNPNGEKVDIIEGLDANDEIKIIGVFTPELSFQETTAKGLIGIGIYAKGSLEALYTAGDLSVTQIQGMTTGDLNPKWSFRTNTKTPNLSA